jgi:hypothetical protein
MSESGAEGNGIHSIRIHDVTCGPCCGKGALDCFLIILISWFCDENMSMMVMLTVLRFDLALSGSRAYPPCMPVACVRTATHRRVCMPEPSPSYVLHQPHTPHWPSGPERLHGPV